MQIATLLMLLFLLTGTAFAQRPHFEINAEAPEGLMLQQAAQAEGEAKQIELYEAYLAKYPAHEGIWWANAQLVPLYLKAGSYDKVIRSASAVLAKDPLNSPIAYNALEAAEKKNDVALVKEWSGRTAEAAQKMLATPKPSDEDEAAEWAREADYARQVITRCEYSLFATALAATDPKVVIDLASTLAERHPGSQYFPRVAPKYVASLQQTGEKDRARSVAEAALEQDNSNEHLLVIVADSYLAAKNNEKALQYSQTLVGVLEQKQPPEGIDSAAWAKKKQALLGLGHWMSGMVYSDQNKWADADKSFRTSLPLIAGNNDLLAPAYFYLGLANYNLSKANPKLRAEAQRFNSLCTKIPSPYQQRAVQNLNSINAGK